ncbi:MAG TPA: 2,3-bisphosphoglycerate-independent phosphoglycerate mutase [Candidatus Nanoarchaeia archaeon]|nr:2,3-bisphosphoglycerate-independent phosphoglycerate mutase [Candidatus Nanoarchaeia archaeon]
MNKVILIIRDGWGYRKEHKDNAIFEAGTPVTDRLMKEYPNTLIKADGEAVGLPEGYQGNSEVGHMTIGAGRTIFQPMVRINNSIADGSFYKNKAFLGAISNCKKNKSKLHLIGLLQSEGVHSHEAHLYALLELCKKESFNDVYIHVITDGRDSPPGDGLKHIQKLVEKLKELGFGKITTLSGRYYGMDRDKRWDRTKKAYDTIVLGEGGEFSDVLGIVGWCYANRETDEFIVPIRLKGYNGIKDKDSVIFFNFRTDRPRQLTQAIVEKDFAGWKRGPLDVFYVTMTEYYKPMNAHAAFLDQSLANLLGEVISRHGIKQLRISETEKYAHVTFFFNGQRETPYDGEDRAMIPSPKVATYDLKPEMSAYEVTERLVSEIETDKYGFIVVNIVNGDLVGHTGVVPACLKAVKVVDECVGKIVTAGLDKNYTMLIFADHGNIEDQSPEWKTSHTIDPVPLVLVSKDKKHALKKGGLGDIAPTVLNLLGIEKPKEMDGKSLI